jgi:hypothetical protein
MDSAVTRLLVQFKRGADTAEAVQTVFKLQPAEFDTRFNAFMQSEFKTLFDKFDAWKNARSTALAAYKRNGALSSRCRNPEYLPNDVEGGSPYVKLARAYNATENPAGAKHTGNIFQTRWPHPMIGAWQRAACGTNRAGRAGAGCHQLCHAVQLRSAW